MRVDGKSGRGSRDYVQLPTGGGPFQCNRKRAEFDNACEAKIVCGGLSRVSLGDASLGRPVYVILRLFYCDLLTHSDRHILRKTSQRKAGLRLSLYSVFIPHPARTRAAATVFFGLETSVGTGHDVAVGSQRETSLVLLLHLLALLSLRLCILLRLVVFHAKEDRKQYDDDEAKKSDDTRH